MNPKTTIALALVLIVGVGAYLIFSPDAGTSPTQEPTDEKKEAKPLYELAKLVKFEIERPGADQPKLVFAKSLKEGKESEYGDWRFVEPIKARTSNWEVNSFADKFKAPKSKGTFTPGKDGFPAADKIGLAKPKVVVTVTDEKGASRKIEVGDRVFGSNETYVRLAGQTEISTAEIDVREDLKKDVKKFRSKDLFDFDKGKAVQIELAHEGKTYLLLKGEAGKWVIDQPVKASADKGKVDSLLSDVRNLRADEFIEDAPKGLKPFGLEKPKTTLAVTIEKKIQEKKKDEPTTQSTQPAAPKIERTVYTVQFGGASDLKGEKFYCKLGDQPWVVSVAKSNYEKVQPKLDEWRDKKITQTKILDATKIDLTVDGGRITLEKKGDTWRMTAPKAGKVEASAVSDLLNALNDMKAANWEDDPKDKTAFGLDKPRAEIVLVVKGQPTPERILVGGNTKSGLLTYVHQAASRSIAVVKLADGKKLLAPTSSYRDRSVMHFAKSRADQIELAGKGATVTLAKQKGAWKMTQPIAADTDVDAVNDLLADLSSLKASQIAGEGDLAPFGLDKPELKVSVRVQPPPEPKPTTTTAPTSTQAAASKPAAKPAPKKPRESKTHILCVTKKGDKIYAAQPKGAVIYQLSKAVYDNLTAEMHDRKPLVFETSKVTGVEVIGGAKPLKFAKKGDAWSYLPDPHLKIDTKKVEDLLKGLGELKIDRYVSYQAKDLKAFGLDKPDMTVTVRTEDKKTVTMLLAKPDKDGKRAATLKGDPGKMKVFAVKKTDVSKFAKEIGDFAKS